MARCSVIVTYPRALASSTSSGRVFQQHTYHKFEDTIDQTRLVAEVRVCWRFRYNKLIAK